MADLVVIVPSRGRPETVAGISATVDATCGADTEALFVVDSDDPARPAYFDAVAAAGERVDIKTGDHRNMVEALNKVAWSLAAAERFAPLAVGFMGDDHRPRTQGWDQAYLDALRELGTGIVYGDDLLQGERLPTQVAMTSDIIRALGHMAPPTLTHMYVDNYWLDLGRAAGCIRYLPDVVVEHMHPFAGKGLMDEGYARVNDQRMYAVDRAAYSRWRCMSMPAEAAKVRALRQVAA